eukprot:TRINITY_DN3880_c0_g1_i1.p1 TRINITY_DN3880_c0_g1~~TRINITY_DN3880_c0_g1_i1.p1  ORF type:complete len:248 (+),score=45.11 TRINITY_DN3880_c0_g1_i1:102-845(+)
MNVDHRPCLTISALLLLVMCVWMSSSFGRTLAPPPAAKLVLAPACSDGALMRPQVSRFILDDGSAFAPAAGQTNVSVCHTQESVRFKFNMTDVSIESPYETCNEPLYKADAVEAFVALDDPATSGPPFHYLEMEISPHGVLFVSSIDNSAGNCTKFSGSQHTCATSNITHTATIEPWGWSATLELPFDTLARFLNAPAGAKPTSLYANLFRIDAVGTQRTYSCWRPTFQSPACFHVPRDFGRIELSN